MREFFLKRSSLGLILASLLMGCGGATSSTSAPQSAPPRFKTTHDEAGLPGWVTRGSAAISEDGGRVFYGVGMAGGIRNPSLLRSTSDNRARNELGKVFQVFSSSLMKDYMASSGEQSVEQATKTFNARALKGVEVLDRYIDSDGTMYSLAALDLKAVGAAVQKAEELGLVKSHDSDESLEKIFDENSRGAPERKSPAVADGSTARPPTASATPPSTPVTTPEYTGTKPGWIDGYDSRFPYTQFLCGVGYGSERSAAQNGAYGALSKIFVAHVKQTSSDFMGAYSTTGALSLEAQASETLTEVSTEKIFAGVELKETWIDSNKTVFALACLERAKAARGLMESIRSLDKQAGALIIQAKQSDRTDRVRKLAKALDTLVQRESLNAELRIIDVNGIGLAGKYTHADIAAAFEVALEALRVGIDANSKYKEDFRSALVAALAKKGYSIVDDIQGANLDVLVRATIRIENGGKGSGRANHIHFARAVVQVDVVHSVKNKLLGSLSQSRKEGHRNLAEAERLAVRKLAKKMSNQVGTTIDLAMKGL